LRIAEGIVASGGWFVKARRQARLTCLSALGLAKAARREYTSAGCGGCEGSYTMIEDLSQAERERMGEVKEILIRGQDSDEETD